VICGLSSASLKGSCGSGAALVLGDTLFKEMSGEEYNLKVLLLAPGPASDVCSSALDVTA